jgi:hypothetical protein
MNPGGLREQGYRHRDAHDHEFFAEKMALPFPLTRVISGISQHRPGATKIVKEAIARFTCNNTPQYRLGDPDLLRCRIRAGPSLGSGPRPELFRFIY